MTDQSPPSDAVASAPSAFPPVGDAVTDHRCWDPKCTAHEDDYVGNPDAPSEGEFVQRHDGNSNIHIVRAVVDDCGAKKVTVACGGGWYASALRHAGGDWPRQCTKCWDAM